MLSATEINIIRRLQEDLPLVSEPYKKLAEDLGITESELLTKIKELKNKKILRRFGAILNHRKVGFHSNAMAVWKIPEEKIIEATEIMISYQQVSHCYQRVTLLNWQYNIFTMIHGKSDLECENVVEKIANAINIKDYCLLYSTAELKKCSMKYFSD